VNSIELRARTKNFALRIMKLVAALPATVQGRAIAGQLMRAGSSVGANYRAVCRARSRKDFINKLGIVIEEADECGFWLEIISDGGLISTSRIEPLLKEANELVAIMVAARSTTIHRNRSSIDRVRK
jgi:four helix bundle protein